MRLLVGMLFLVAYFQVLQFGRDAVGSDISGPLIALWLPFGIFGTISVWLFHLANSRPGADPLAHVFESLSDGASSIARHLRRLVPRRWRREAAE
jgi:lipopolysaccharide export system permease protein